MPPQIATRVIPNYRDRLRGATTSHPSNASLVPYHALLSMLMRDVLYDRHLTVCTANNLYVHCCTHLTQQPHVPQVAASGLRYHAECSGVTLNS